ncbi:TonB family protein [Pseudomonas sp. FP2196]|uniref:energy transducer TonB n=1 Tax=Pseudomonas sp. FP2196 TaxID=2954086 RepID=UPI002733204D|nr:energy transducer TonB [Pseudomonas sp. FP2196]WLH33588.1 TonB family protein [Pseudomonas sp. FP2196]
MTAMIMHSPATICAPMPRSHFWQHSLAATLAVALHVVVLVLLISAWSPSPPQVQPPRVMTTQLVMVAPPVAQPPAPEPTPAPAIESVAAAPVEPVKPKAEPAAQTQKIEQAALARKRVDERKREQLAEQQREQARQREDDAARQRQAQQQAAQQRASQAQQQAQQAERARQQALADSRQYLPLSKEAPEYPERALDKNIEGDCSVEYTVNPQGRVENPKVLDGCHPLFIRPSLAAAQTFRYQPRIIDGVAVSVPAVRNTFHYRIK